MNPPLQHTTPDPVRALLDEARDCRRAAEDLDRRVFIAAAEWALAHPAADMDDAACLPGTENELALAGDGAPLVAGFCVPEFAAVIGLSTDAGHLYMADALELRARLPRCWRRVAAGEVTVWRARKIAQATRLLSPAAADLVDQRLASFAHAIGGRGIDQTVKAAEAQTDPELVAERKHESEDKRHFTVESRFVDYYGQVDVHGTLDLVDALDLDDAITAIASQLKDCGSTESLDARRAQALGELARNQGALPLGSSDQPTEGSKRGRRTLQVYVHLNQTSAENPSGLSGPFGAVARVENTRTAIDLDTIRSWCADPDNQLIVRPVLDLAEHRSSEAYEIPPLLREQVILRDVTCVFPHCTRPARTADVDHIEPFDDGGSTESTNLAAGCRRHHRLKTHGGWRYLALERYGGPPGTYLWTSPQGQQYLRTPTGTVALPTIGATAVRTAGGAAVRTLTTTA